MLLFAIAMVVFPLFRKSRMDEVAGSEYDSTVYRDQLKELDRDIERGTIDAKQAKSARNEIARRLLQAERSQKITNTPGVAGSRITGIISAVIIIPAVAGLFYMKVGHPEMPDLPQEQRLAKALAKGDMSALVIKVERILAKNPNDLKGWSVLAPTYKRLRRYDDAARAYERILTLTRPTASLLTEYAEAMIMANGGRGDEQIEKTLNKALELDSKFNKARFYRAAMWQQQGKSRQALGEWRSMIRDNPKNIELQMAVQRQIAKIEGPDDSKLPAVSDEGRKQVEQMSPEDRQQMIRNMVDGLEEKLDEDGSDLQGWMRLIGARMVLREKSKALASLAKARENFKDKPEAMAKLADLAKRLGL